MKKDVIYLFVLLMFIVSCSNSDTINQSSDGTSTITDGDGSDGDGSDGDGSDGDGSDGGSDGNSDWLIPIDEVRDGGPGKDGIPSIDNPIFVSANHSDASYLDDDELVVGILINNEARAYPHLILDWHEVINDKFNDEFITLNYCPLTGTGFSWKSYADFEFSAFGVSGLLYNANLILYDRISDSKWSQLKLQCVNGPALGDEPILGDVVETTWGIWKKIYPNTKVLSLDTGFSRNYGTYPYGRYKTNDNYFIFPAKPTNNTLPNKERVYAIIDNGISKVYRFSNFTNGNIIKETFQNNEYLIAGNENLINAFKLSEPYSNLEFEYNFTDNESFFKDNEGNEWSIFGNAISGPRTGETLTISKSVVSYWFAIAAFYPNPEIYHE